MSRWQMNFDPLPGLATQTLIVETQHGSFFQADRYHAMDSIDGGGATVVAVEIGGVKQRWGQQEPSDGMKGDARLRAMPSMDLCLPTETIRFHVKFDLDCTWHGGMAGDGAYSDETKKKLGLWQKVDVPTVEHMRILDLEAALKEEREKRVEAAQMAVDALKTASECSAESLLWRQKYAALMLRVALEARR